MQYSRVILSALACVLFLAKIGLADVFQFSNLIVSGASSRVVSEYNEQGQQVSSIFVNPPGTSVLDTGDITMDAAGNLYVYSNYSPGTLTRVDEVTFAQTTISGVGFSSVFAIDVPSVAALGDRIYVNDCNTGGSPDHGIVAFDLSNGLSSQRFASNFSPNDITAGRDGLLYALGEFSQDNSTTPSVIVAFNPLDFSEVGRIKLASNVASLDLSGVVADSQGRVFGATLGGEVIEINRLGEIVRRLDVNRTGGGRLIDIDIDQNGRLLMGGDGGRFYLSNTDLLSVTNFRATGALQNDFLHVSFGAPVQAVPEPSSLALCAFAIVAYLRLRRKRC